MLLRGQAGTIRLLGEVDETRWFVAQEGTGEMTLRVMDSKDLQGYRVVLEDPATYGCLVVLANQATEWAKRILAGDS